MIDPIPVACSAIRIETVGVAIDVRETLLIVLDGLFGLPASGVEKRGALDPVDLVRKPRHELEANPLCLVETTDLDQIEDTIRELLELGELGVEPIGIRIVREHASNDSSPVGRRTLIIE